MRQKVFLKGAIAAGVLGLMGAGSAFAQASCTETTFNSKTGQLYLEVEQAAITNKDFDTALAKINQLRGMELNCYEESAIIRISAYIKIEKGDQRGAIKDLLDAVNKGFVPPSDVAQTYYNIAQLYLQLEDTKSALDYMQKWQSAGGKPDRAQNWQLAVLYSHVDNYKDALRHAEEARMADGSRFDQPLFDLLIALYNYSGNEAKMEEVLDAWPSQRARLEYCSKSDAVGMVLGDGVVEPEQFFRAHPGPKDEFESTATYSHRLRSAFAQFLDRPFLFESEIWSFRYNADSQRMMVGVDGHPAVTVLQHKDADLTLYRSLQEDRPNLWLGLGGFSSVEEASMPVYKLPEGAGFRIDPESARRVKGSGRIYFVATIKDVQDQSYRILSSPYWSRSLAAEAEIHCVVFADRDGYVIARELPSSSKIERGVSSINVGHTPGRNAEQIRQQSSDRDARPIRPPVPSYPQRAQQRGLSGSCDVRFDVDPRGKPYNVAATCTDAVFKTEAERAVSEVEFVPKIVDGKAVERLNVVYPLEFNLY
jgi:TonB family protein